MSNLVMENKENTLSIENFKTLRTNIQFCLEAEEDNCFVITSSKPEEGKSYIASNLASVFALADYKTVVLDLDLRRHTQHIKMGVENKEGMVNILANKKFEDEKYIEKNIKKYITHTEIENLDLITAGQTTVIPPELLLKPRFNKIVEYLKTKYDYVILDTPPINVVADTSIVARDRNVLIVTSMNETEIPLLKRTIETLKGLNCKILGSVINKVPTTKNQYYKYGYNYGYEYTSRYTTSLVKAKENKPLVKKIKNKAIRTLDLAISITALPIASFTMFMLYAIAKANKIEKVFVKDTVKTRHDHEKEAFKFNTVIKNNFTSFLEKTKLENLPHIFNYINGDLSFIKK